MATQSEAVSVSITVNGQTHQASVPPHRLLADFLREDLGLTGTKVGCETGQCGACTILLDGVAVKGCTVLAAQADGSQVTTIEGLAGDGALTRVQTALWEEHGVQCGYCTPAMVLAMTDLLSTNPHPSDHDIRKSMDGIICRCGVYQNVVRAVQTLI
jgi:aerobic carbon-monoxide dehydrogenase small subunit